MRLKRLLVIGLTLFGLSNITALADEPMLKATPFSQIENKIGKEPIMLEFGATHCRSCIAMGKMLYKMKEKYPKGNIYFIDIYEDKETARKFKIRVIPTQKYIDSNGSVVDTHMGVIEKDELEEKLKTVGVIK